LKEEISVALPAGPVVRISVKRIESAKRLQDAEAFDVGISVKRIESFAGNLLTGRME